MKRGSEWSVVQLFGVASGTKYESRMMPFMQASHGGEVVRQRERVVVDSQSAEHNSTQEREVRYGGVVTPHTHMRWWVRGADRGVRETRFDVAHCVKPLAAGDHAPGMALAQLEQLVQFMERMLHSLGPAEKCAPRSCD